MLKQFGEQGPAAMPEKKLHKLRDALVVKYEDESAEHGVERLEIQSPR